MFFNFINSFFNIQNNIFNIDSVLLRSLLAFVFSFIFSIIGLRYLISYLKNHHTFQPIRVEGPEGHLITKQKTPTMGGAVSCLAILFSGLLFCNLSDIYVIATLVVSMSFGAIGFIDDFIKVFYKNTNGFKGSIKLVLQMAIAGLVILWLMYSDSSIIDNQGIFIPFFKVLFCIGILFVPFLIMVIVGSANAVNMTDGLDGLAIVPVMICTIIFGIMAFISGYGDNINIISSINKDNLSELTILCSALVGSGIGLFLYNKNPAKIFMGDVGSLMYGSFLGCMAVFLRYEIFYGIAGLLFVIEACSVILQVASYKLFKKRIFKMAPIHHHFEKLGWSERKVVLSFWGFSVFCLLIALFGIINF